MRPKITIVALLLAAAAGPAAAQLNLRVNPYPVPHPFLDSTAERGEKGSGDKVQFSVSYAGSKYHQAGAADIKLNGAALGLTYLSPISDRLAWDAGVAIVPMVGSVGDTSLSFVGVPLTTDAEYQVYRTDAFGVLLFAGPHFSISSAKQDQKFVGTTFDYVEPQSATGFRYGLQFGGEVGFKAGSFVAAPFLMLSPEWGYSTRNFYHYVGATKVYDHASASFPASMMTSFGVQTFLGSGFGASIVSQTVPTKKSGSNTYNGFRNLLVNLNFIF